MSNTNILTIFIQITIKPRVNYKLHKFFPCRVITRRPFQYVITHRANIEYPEGIDDMEICFDEKPWIGTHKPHQ